MPEPFVIPKHTTRIEIDRAVSRFRYFHAIIEPNGQISYLHRHLGAILGVATEQGRKDWLLHDARTMWHVRLVQSARL